MDQITGTTAATQQAPAGQVRVVFDRIGRNHNVAPLIVDSTDADVIAEAVYRHARPHLGSRDVEAVVDMEKMTGSIFCGFSNGGTFTIERQQPGLTRVSGVHNHLQTWAVHDGKVCVYLAKTPTTDHYIGVFCCTLAEPGPYVDDCPWLGHCKTDAYITMAARPIHDKAAASGWDETVIYGLLEELHAEEVAR